MPSDKSMMRSNFSFLALVSFIVSFAIARIFTSFLPGTVLVVSGSHIHHFWFGLALMAIGGWLGIVYDEDRIERVAAILYGAGGGLIGDEIGLLITFQNYWSEITYTFVIGVIAAASILIIAWRYNKTIRNEFAEFIRGNESLYLGVFLVGLSVAFILDTDDMAITVLSGLGTVIGAILITAYLFRRFLRVNSSNQN